MNVIITFVALIGKNRIFLLYYESKLVLKLFMATMQRFLAEFFFFFCLYNSLHWNFYPDNNEKR